MAAYTVYTPEQKAAAVADLLAGNSQRYVARTHGLPRGTVARWQRETSQALVASVERRSTFEQEVKAELERLVLKNLRALVEVDSLTENEAWLLRQDSAELAVFYGVLFDKTYRLLRNYTPASPGGEDSHDR